jgi:uncharacterized membrane protein YqiK
MGWLQDYNGAETTWVHVVLLVIMVIVGVLIFWLAGPDSAPITEPPPD